MQGKGRNLFSSLLNLLSLFSPFPSPLSSWHTGYDLIDRIDRLIDRKAKEVMGNEFFVSNHIILVYIFFLISIGLSLSDEANKYWKSTTISVISENLSPDIWNSFGEILLEKPQNLQCYPVILQFLIATIFFATNCKELKLAQTA